MTGEQLKNSILQMTVQGKLVPQDPNDEPASVLLERIRAEKEQLIKEGKIKREKNPSRIFRGADNLPYEQIGKNEPVCIADEVPFDIPDSWEWVRISTISTVVTKGTTPRGGNVAYENMGIGFLRAENIAGMDMLNKNNLNHINEETHFGYLKRSILFANDILVTIAGTLGRTAIVRENDLPLNANQAISIIRLVDSEQFNLMYFVYALNSPIIQKTLTAQKKITAIPNLTLEIISNCLLPVPPLEEQERIVDEFRKYTNLLKSYGKKEAELAQLNREFPDQLKKSILQQAVQGKLVPQSENDEPASVLLERIRAEKEQLIKAGKIKRDKHESVIFKRDNSHYEIIDGKERCIDDELPFEIPDSWEWVRLKSIAIVNPRNIESDDLDAGFIPMPLLMGGYCNKHTFETKKWKKIKNGFTHFRNDDIVVAKISPCFQNRKSAIIQGLPNGIGAGTTELHVIRRIYDKISNEFLLSTFKSAYFIDNGVKIFSGTAGQQRVSKEYIENFLIALPPLAEQQRIVKKINEFLAIVENLK